MIRRERIFLAGAVVLALAFLVVPVAADKYVVTSSSYSPTAGADVTISAQLSFDNGTAIATSGKTVTWTRTPSSGTFAAATSSTNSNGIATVTFTTATTGGIAYYFTATDGDSTTGTSAVVTTAVVSPTISLVTPASATNGESQTLQIDGSNFGTIGTTVSLSKSGETTINGATTSTSDTTTRLYRNFALTDVATGTWTLTVLNSDGGSDTETFTVSGATAATVTSISPTSGIVNDTVTVTIAGTGFTSSSAKIRLYKSGILKIPGTVSSGSSTSLTGSFDLDYATPATYDVCVLSDGSEASKVCGPTFIVKPENAVNGSLYFSSAPSGASIYVDSTYKGKTPMTLDNVVPGTHSIKIEKAQYVDYTKSVTVVAGEEVTVSASLTYKTSATTATPTTIIVTTATLPPTTVKSTAVVPTAWPSDTPVPESPISFVVIAGALAAFVVLVRKQE